jgi:glycosyltransferase involved in cell wall biosynthesis
MTRIRVAHVTNFDLGIGIHMRNYLLYLQEQGYDLTVVYHPGQYLQGDGVTDFGIPVKAMTFQRRISPLADLKALVSLIRYFRHERFDIVHTHTVKPGLLGRVAARLAGVPVIIHTIHGFYFHEHMRPPVMRFYVLMEQIGHRCGDLLLSQNQEDLAFAIGHGICRPEEIAMLGNGIDVRSFDPAQVTADTIAAKRAEIGIAPGEPVVGMIGRLIREKGFFEYAEAARILAQRGVTARFLAVGATQPDKTGAIDPRELIEGYGLKDTFLFLGVRRDIRELIATMDVLVLASVAEGVPRVVMEAAAMGKPVVATDVRGTRETVVDGETGLLVPYAAPQALADAIQKLLSDRELAQQMGSAARARALSRFDEQLYFRKTDWEYRRLLALNAPDRSLTYLRPIPEVANS